MNFSEVEFDNTKPVYIQIIDIVKKQIINGEINPCEKLPSVRELAALFKVNVNTLQKAYKELDREGVTVTKRGMGSFVTNDEDVISKLKSEMAGETVDRFLRDMNDMGYSREDIIKILNERG